VICPNCKYAAKLWANGLCEYDNAFHRTGEFFIDCERYVRNHIEHAGGAGQLLAAVKADHTRQETGALLIRVEELHGPGKCPGYTWCDCQHTILPKPISP
jgi:hypothetical protein